MLKKEFLPQDYFENLLYKIIEKKDTDTIIIWYNLLNNKIIAKDVHELLHYMIIWESWSWKTVLLLSILYQFLMKPYSEAVLLEKWTDSDYWFTKIKNFIYKSNVESADDSTIITIFT